MDALKQKVAYFEVEDAKTSNNITPLLTIA
jgi:hypothetical protein